MAPATGKALHSIVNEILAHPQGLLEFLTATASTLYLLSSKQNMFNPSNQSCDMV